MILNAAFLSALPIVMVIGTLALGVRSIVSAALGLASALLVMLIAFPVTAETFGDALVTWVPVTIEVMLIIWGGIALAEAMGQRGAQAELGSWLRSRTNHGTLAVLMVVHGVTPFAESVTGFGIGITVGIPLLCHFGLPVRKAIILGLLGLCAVPWGSMGPGTLIAAQMASLDLTSLGIASAYVSVVPFILTGVVAAWMTSPPQARLAAISVGVVSGLVFAALLLGFNTAVGTPPAGALASLVMIAGYLVLGSSKAGTRQPVSALGRHALWTYGVLIGGILVATICLRILGLSGDWRYVASPAVWLVLATLYFLKMAPSRSIYAAAFGKWLNAGPVTGIFVMTGVCMAVSGMAGALAQMLATSGHAYLAISPFVSGTGGFITGSNTGANAMFAATQAEIARSLDFDVLWFMAVHNVSAAFLLMASPAKVELAVRLAGSDAGAHQRSIQLTMIAICAVTLALLGACSLVAL